MLEYRISRVISFVMMIAAVFMLEYTLFSNEEFDILLVAAICALILVLLYLPNMILRKYEKAAVYALDFECDPKKYLGFLEEELKTRFPFYTTLRIKMNMAIAYEELGEYEQAYSLMKSIDEAKVNNIIFKNMYYIILYGLSISANKLDEASFYRAKFIEYYNQIKQYKKAMLMFFQSLKINDAIFELLSGNYEYALKPLNEVYSNTNNNRLKLTVLYYIAYAEYKTNDYGSALYKFSQVFEKANGLYIREKANEYIELINEGK